MVEVGRGHRRLSSPLSLLNYGLLEYVTQCYIQTVFYYLQKVRLPNLTVKRVDNLSGEGSLIAGL